MNALGDDHVSFSASHLAASPCKKYLLVSTEGSRIIMFRVQGTSAQAHSNFILLVTKAKRPYAHDYVRRLDTGKEFLWFECGRKVSPTLCCLAPQRFLHFCSCSSWHCQCLSCGNNQGMPQCWLFSWCSFMPNWYASCAVSIKFALYGAGEAHLCFQVEAQLKAHLKNVRALDYNPTTNTLVTCSFDKTVKVFTAP